MPRRCAQPPPPPQHTRAAGRSSRRSSSSDATPSRSGLSRAWGQPSGRGGPPCLQGVQPMQGLGVQRGLCPIMASTTRSIISSCQWRAASRCPAAVAAAAASAAGNRPRCLGASASNYARRCWLLLPRRLLLRRPALQGASRSRGASTGPCTKWAAHAWQVGLLWLCWLREHAAGSLVPAHAASAPPAAAGRRRAPPPQPPSAHAARPSPQLPSASRPWRT